MTLLNGVIAAAVSLSPRCRELFEETPLGAFLFTWISLSAVVLPVYVLSTVVRMAFSRSPESECREEEAALVIDFVVVGGLLFALLISYWLGYLW